jgi:hypothetical protein
MDEFIRGKVSFLSRGNWKTFNNYSQKGSFCLAGYEDLIAS